VSTSGFSVSAVRFLPVQAILRARDLLIASWEADRESVARSVPAEIEPAEVDGRFLVSVVSFAVEGGRVGRLPVLPYAQLNVRTYVRWDEPAVFFLAARVTALGLPGVLLGAPFRHARLRVRPGSVQAGGLGVSVRYRLEDGAEPGALGRHELGLFENDGLRSFRIRRTETSWRRAVPTEPVRADFLVALGFELRADPDLLYAERTSFETEVPPRRLQ
jgi:Uncharacterized conserved protein (COG2071)